MNFKPELNIINTKEELFSIIQSARKYRCFCMIHGIQVMEMFRGQGRDTWKLLPNISRKLKTPEEVKKIEKAIVTEFNKELVENGHSKSLQGKFLKSEFHNEWLLLQQSQHYGIPTRFMDWTIDWEVALFFAVSNPEDDDFDGQFWIYVVPKDKRAIDDYEYPDCHLNSDPFSYKPTIFLNSSGFLSGDYLNQIGERRKARQHGRFCIQPYEKLFIPLEDQDEHKPHLSKIIIPRHLKKPLREELAQMNITNESLYVEENATINDIIKKLRSKYNV